MINDLVQQMKTILDDRCKEYRTYMPKQAYYDARNQVIHVIFGIGDMPGTQKDLDEFPQFVENVFALYQQGKYNKQTGRMI